MSFGFDRKEWGCKEVLKRDGLYSVADVLEVADVRVLVVRVVESGDGGGGEEEKVLDSPMSAAEDSSSSLVSDKLEGQGPGLDIQ